MKIEIWSKGFKVTDKGILIRLKMLLVYLEMSNEYFTVNNICRQFNTFIRYVLKAPIRTATKVPELCPEVDPNICHIKVVCIFHNFATELGCYAGNQSKNVLQLK